MERGLIGKAESDNFGGKLRQQQAVPDSVGDDGEYGPTLSTTAALIRKNIQKTTSASTKAAAAATRPRTDTSSSSRLRTGLETTTEMPEDPKVLDEMMF